MSADIERIREALHYVPADDRSTWVKMAFAIKDEFGDAGFDLWDAWSQQAESYNSASSRAVWKSADGTGPLKIGTLIHEAKAHGWTEALTGATSKTDGLPRKPAQDHAQPKPGRDTGAYALRLWGSAEFDDSIVGSHPYATRKGICWAAGAGRCIASGSRIGTNADCLIIPIRTDAIGPLQGAQLINAEGDKQTFGPIHGGCLVLGNTLDPTIPWFVAEGWASAVSAVFHHKGGNAVCGVSFGKHNLLKIAEMLAGAFSPDEIVILGERDD